MYNMKVLKLTWYICSSDINFFTSQPWNVKTINVNENKIKIAFATVYSKTLHCMEEALSKPVPYWDFLLHVCNEIQCNP